MVAAYEADVYMEVEKHNFVSSVEVDTSNIFWNMINVLLMMLWFVTIRSIYVSQRITFVPSNYLFDCPAFFACLNRSIHFQRFVRFYNHFEYCLKPSSWRSHYWFETNHNMLVARRIWYIFRRRNFKKVKQINENGVTDTPLIL